ncbi:MULTISPECIES: methylenetetrahydrofolate reductase [Amycolatopsis]|uniref:Methylenetetrahydrofolate reductase n=2 Tax=Amycolatopsis TaxID=1813 RepID=A0A1I4AKH2_9PSEU|nr:methylenetetrahydrofolate reductase [Amycolatopsis sacchari]SFK56239.1 methylenetetrahydrofolate reductase (NADPH) [Amycolatopsis sacchari]
MTETTTRRRAPRSTRDILRTISYEIMPFRGTEDAVLEHVPVDVPLTVTVTEAKGIETTIALAANLTARGYRVSPHVAARMVRDTAHAKDLAAQLTEAGIDRVFVVGGDAPVPAGEFTEALDLLRVFAETGMFTRTGIGGYPEGHARITDQDLDAALTAKAPLATHVITQICFDARTTVDWARRVHRGHPDLEVVIGVPAPVSRQKLVRIAGGIGLGQSARFLRKQQNTIWKLIRPGGYRPDKLLRAFEPHLAAPDVNIAGIHLFTFNELAGAEAWRRSLLARLDAG